MKKCIAILTRGYTENKEYDDLLKRNSSIECNLIDKTIDILIFHEGNISIEQQLYIKKYTSSLNIIFIDISIKAFKKEKKNITNENLSYKHMCSFWFVDFWNFVESYDLLLRIDEDCILYNNIDDIFSKLEKYNIIAGGFMFDEYVVTIGLKDFTRNFIKENSSNYSFFEDEISNSGIQHFQDKFLKKNIPNYTILNEDISNIPYGPYTNVIGLSLHNIRKNETFNKYVKSIDESNKIYKRRWGDLPLWGESISYIFGHSTCSIDNSIKYYHKSHEIHVN